MSTELADCVLEAVNASLRATFERDLAVVLPNLTRYARFLARDPDAANDLVQEALLRAWAARGRFVAGTNFKAWCYRILRNCFLSQVRHRQVARTESRGDDLPEIPVAPVQEVALELKDVVRIWRLLPDDQQRSLALVAIDGHSYEVAAAIDKVPLGTMKSRIARARHALLALLDGDHGVSEQVLTVSEVQVEAQTEMASHAVPDTISAVDRAQAELLLAWRNRRHSASLPVAA